MLLILPLAVVIVYSFGERAPTGGYQAAFTFANYLNLPARADRLPQYPDPGAHGHADLPLDRLSPGLFPGGEIHAPRAGCS